MNTRIENTLRTRRIDRLWGRMLYEHAHGTLLRFATNMS